MNIHKSASIVFITCLLIFAPFTAAWASGPGGTVVEAIERGLKILKDPSMQGANKFGERKQKLWEILTPVFNFEETSKRSLGYHWKDRTGEEQKKFVEVFTQVLRDIYLGKTDSYTGGEFIYIREIEKGNRGKVRTNFITVENKKVVVDFSMHKVGDAWKIYDVTVEGVSMVGNYRSQFAAILSKESFGELMVKLKDKRDEFIITQDKALKE